MTSSVEVGARRRERDELGRGLDHLLEVVEEEQQLPLADVLGEAVPGAERLRDRLGDERGVAQRGEPDPEDAGLVRRDERRRRLEREPRLARAAGAGERDEARARSRCVESTSRELRSRADEGARRARQVRVRDRLERRERVAPELEDRRPASVDVLEPVLAEIGERRSSTSAAGRAARGRPARRARRRRRRAAKWTSSPDVALVGDERRPRVQADAHADRARSERLGRVARGRERARRGREGEEEGVALRVDLDPAVSPRTRRGSARRCSASASAYASAPSSCSSLRRALDVREEEGDGAGREVGRASARTMRSRCARACAG